MPRQIKYTKDVIECAVRGTTSMAGVLRSFGLNITGGNYKHITGYVKKYKTDTSHFTSQGWANGKTKQTSDAVARGAMKLRTPDKDVFKKGSTYRPSLLAKRLLELGRDYKCANDACGLNKWFDEPICLHVDHINGDHTDHRLKNIRFLCPNCHQQTKTWGNKNRRG